MRIQNFEDIIAWQKGKQLFIEVNMLFGQSKDFFFKDQILRASLSVTNNIAEGFDRGSDKELKQFLIISRGSCAEVRSMLIIAIETKKISQEDFERILLITKEISRLLTGFVRKLATGDRRLETT